MSVSQADVDARMYEQDEETPRSVIQGVYEDILVNIEAVSDALKEDRAHILAKEQRLEKLTAQAEVFAAWLRVNP